MFSYFSTKKEHVFDLQQKYLRVEFLTQDQKVRKEKVVTDLQKEFGNDDEVIIPYESNIECGYRHLMKHKYSTKTESLAKVMVKEIIAHIQITTDKGLAEFMGYNVDKVTMIMQNGKALDPNQVIKLYDERQVSSYDPNEVLEIIYTPKSFWSRMKSRAISTFKKAPSLFISLLGKLLNHILFMAGFSAKSMVWSFLPSKVIIQWVLSFVTMAFPALAPFLMVSKAFL